MALSVHYPKTPKPHVFSVIEVDKESVSPSQRKDNKLEVNKLVGSNSTTLSSFTTERLTSHTSI
ncbi:MAG: hypothetical protein ACK53Y_26565 [bacterium]